MSILHHVYIAPCLYCIMSILHHVYIASCLYCIMFILHHTRVNLNYLNNRLKYLLLEFSVSLLYISSSTIYYYLLSHITTASHAFQSIFTNDILSVGGWECQAILGGQLFLQERFIPYILMRWYFMAQRLHGNDTPCPIAKMKRMVFVLTSRGFSPFGAEEGVSLSIKNFTAWTVNEVIWKHHRAVNVLDRSIEELIVE